MSYIGIKPFYDRSLILRLHLGDLLPSHTGNSVYLSCSYNPFFGQTGEVAGTLPPEYELNGAANGVFARNTIESLLSNLSFAT